MIDKFWRKGFATIGKSYLLGIGAGLGAIAPTGDLAVQYAWVFLAGLVPAVPQAARVLDNYARGQPPAT